MSGLAASSAGRAQQRAANQAASIRRQQGAINARQTLMEGRRFAGEQLAAISGSGVDVGVGSPLELANETAREVDWRVNLARWEAESDAVGLENRGRLAHWEGNVRRSQAFGQAAGSLFRAGTSAFSSFGGGGVGGGGGALDTVGQRSGATFYENA